MGVGGLQTRNVWLWPLWLLGYFDDGTEHIAELVPSEAGSVKFTSGYHLESAANPARQIVVQMQNRFVEVASATLRIEAHVGWW